jgi:hypothetical protein
MTQRGIIHYKSDAGLLSTNFSNTLEYGTAHTNVLSYSGSYNGISYNMSNINFSQIGFVLDVSGNTILDASTITNSWSSSLTNVFQTANIINDLNALSTQFSGNFKVDIPGSLKKYKVAEPESFLVLNGNTVSPISGIYNIMKVSHTISNSFVTSLTLQRLVTSSANQVATARGILVNGTSQYNNNSFIKTPNIISPYKVDFGDMYPDFTHMFTL